MTKDGMAFKLSLRQRLAFIKFEFEKPNMERAPNSCYTFGDKNMIKQALMYILINKIMTSIILNNTTEANVGGGRKLHYDNWISL